MGKNVFARIALNVSLLLLYLPFADYLIMAVLGISVSEGFFILGYQESNILPWQIYLAPVANLTAGLLFILWIATPMMPIKYFMVPIACLLWRSVGFFPLPLHTHPYKVWIIGNTAAVAMVMIACLPLLWLGFLETSLRASLRSPLRSLRSVESWTLPLLPTDGVSGSLRRSLVLLGATVGTVLILLGIAFCWTAKAVYFSDDEAPGTTHSLNGIYTHSYLAVKGSKQIYLLGLAHLGPASFYQALLDIAPKTNCLVLKETISLEEKDAPCSECRSLYDGIAKHSKQLTQEEIFDAAIHSKDRCASVNADVKFDELSLPARLHLQDFLKKNAALKNIAVHSRSADKADASLKIDSSFEPELIGFRNQRLLETLARELPKHDVIVIPWGANHTPGILEGIKAMGFQVEQVYPVQFQSRASMIAEIVAIGKRLIVHRHNASRPLEVPREAPEK